MRRAETICAVLTSLIALSSVAALGGQTPLGKDASDLRAHLGLQALDRYLETWNSRDPGRWATSLNFPHVRPGPGAFELFKTPAQYAASVNFAQTIATGWHHSEWTTRRVLQVGVDKVHVAGSWLRYTEDGRQLVGTSVTYIVTDQGGRWGVLSRFAAGPTGTEPAIAAANATAARQTVDAYFRAWNSHEPKALVRELRAAGGDLKALRLALTGRDRGPELSAILAALPKEEALRRVDQALQHAQP